MDDRSYVLRVSVINTAREDYDTGCTVFEFVFDDGMVIFCNVSHMVIWQLGDQSMEALVRHLFQYVERRRTYG